MASFNPPIVSDALRETAQLKFDQINRSTVAFKERYGHLQASDTSEKDTVKRITELLEIIKEFDPYLEDDDDLDSPARYLEQAKNDRSISSAKLLQIERRILEKLSMSEHVRDTARIHNSLLKEAIQSKSPEDVVADKLEKAALEDEYELVEDELESVFEKFEKNTFSAPNINVEELEKYLSDLFDGDVGKACLEQLRADVKEQADSVLAGHDEVNDEILEWCIKDLIQNGMLSDERKQTLQGYLQSPASIRELVSLLNTKSVRNWKWRNVEKGLPVTARQDAEGKYTIVVEEEIIDMLFLHTIAIHWAVMLKQILTSMTGNNGLWTRNKYLTKENLDIENYYMAGPAKKPAPPKQTVCTMCHVPPRGPMPPGPQYFDGPPLPPSGPVPIMPYVPPTIYPPIVTGKHKHPKKSKQRAFPKVAMPLGSSQGLNEERNRTYLLNHFLSRVPVRSGRGFSIDTVQETQSNMMEFLASEARVREALDGQVHGVAANIHSFASSLPHQAILTVFKFIGVPDKWMEIFKIFLEAPLNMGPVVRGTSDQVRTRTAGVPIAHGMEVLMGEVCLFFLDFAVHKKTSAYLYRLRDRCFFVGKPEHCTETEDQINLFARALGLNVSVTDIGEDSIGFLKLGIKTGKPVTFTLNDSKVEAYARHVKKQLAASSSTLAWIRTWNLMVGNYASHLFGPLLTVFGKPHVEIVTQAHKKIHEIIFEGSNLTDRVKSLLLPHLPTELATNESFPLEAMIFLPVAFGGLGVKNPYVTLNLTRDLGEDPRTIMQEYLDTEKEYYKACTENFDKLTQKQRDNRIIGIFGEKPDPISDTFGEYDPTSFLSFEQFSQYRERISYPTVLGLPRNVTAPVLLSTYHALRELSEDYIPGQDRVVENIRKRGTRSWYTLENEDKWTLQLYSNECFEWWGSMKIWDADDVPLELLKMVRGDEEDFADNLSNYSSEV